MIQIRKATSKDLDILCDISATTFRETFVGDNTAEDMALYIAQHFSPEQMLEEIKNPNSSFFLAYSTGEQCLGYLKLNTDKAQTEPQEPNALEIERIYVCREGQGKGIGQALLDMAIQLSSEGNHAYLWLGVWEHNHKAIHFYERNGFTIFGEHTFVLGSDHQRDLLMKRTNL